MEQRDEFGRKSFEDFGRFCMWSKSARRSRKWKLELAASCGWRRDPCPELLYIGEHEGVVLCYYSTKTL